MQTQINLFALQASVKGSRIKVRGARSELYKVYLYSCLSLNNDIVNIIKYDYKTLCSLSAEVICIHLQY